MHSLLCSFYDLYTAPAVREMKRSGIELKAQLVQASVVAAPAVNRRIRSMGRLRAQRKSARECLHSLLCSFYDLYTAPAVREMKRSGIELKAQLVQASVVAAPAVNRRIRSMGRLRAQRKSARECLHSLLCSFYDLYTAPAVREMKQSGIELKAQLVQVSICMESGDICSELFFKLGRDSFNWSDFV